MKNVLIKPLFYISIVAFCCLTLLSCNNDDNSMGNQDMPGQAPNVNFTALTNNNRLVYYNAQNLSSPINTLNITGLIEGEMLMSIDYRPATGQLYAIGSMGRLYFINETSGLATRVSQQQLQPNISGDNVSIDFNPTVDRIRLVTESGQNVRLHPELGTVVATDGMINGGNNPRIGAVAYTNSRAGASSTLLYDIDFEENKLYIQNPPNDGGLELVGNLNVNFEGIGDFDINPDNSTALAVTFESNMSKLYTIDLETGAARWVGSFNLPIISLSFKTNPVAFATSMDNMLYRFNPTNPTPNSVAMSGLNTGEYVVGLDFRPANGTLFALSSQSRLFTVNTANGQLTAIGSTLNPMLSGTQFGFDFNPTVDRIRLVSNTGQNLRLHPDLGTVVATDGNLNPGSPSVTAAAYTNNFASSTATVLYVIDSETNMLYTQSPPNDGVLNPVGSLGVNVDAENGFDIGGESNRAYAIFKVNGTNGVYSINLSSGAATLIAPISVDITAMAVGLGF